MNRATKITDKNIHLGTLRLGKFIGQGGFGSVHEANLEGIDFKFAIKLLDPSPFNTDSAAARRRFFQEAEILFKLRHPHIVAIYGIGEHEGRPYILMERLRGKNLNEARSISAPNPDQALAFLEGAASGLEYAHKAGVLHRDIKPSNLMALRSEARILDFGIATILDPDGSRMTRTGGSCVGDAFSAPELVENPKLKDPRCDVYSLGACWFWLLTGQAPKGLQWEEALRSRVQITPDYERVLLRCLEQPSRRYPGMQELLADIRALRNGVRPGAGHELLTNDDAIIFGVLVGSCLGTQGSLSSYYLEQNLHGAVTRFSLAMSTRRLSRQGLIEQFMESDDFGNESASLRVTEVGMTWAEKNRERIEAELKRIKPPPSPSYGKKDDDIPF